MSDQIALSQAEFAAIVEVAVREAVRKSTPVAITPVIEPAKPVTSEEVRAIITESQKVTFQSNIASNSLAPTIVTAIDRTLGGKMFAGKKTLIAVAAAVTGAVLAKLGYVSANISDIINIVAAGLGAAGVLSKIDRVIEGRILEK